MAYLNGEKRRVLGFIYTELPLLTTLGVTPCSHTQTPRVRLNADQQLAEQRAPPEPRTPNFHHTGPAQGPAPSQLPRPCSLLPSTRPAAPPRPSQPLTRLPFPRLGAVPHSSPPGQALQVAVLRGQAGHAAAPPAACPFLCRPAGSDAATHSRKCPPQGVAMATAVLPGCGGPRGLPAAPPPPLRSLQAQGWRPPRGAWGVGTREAPLGLFWGRVSADTKQGARRKLPLHELAWFGVLLAGPGLQLEGFAYRNARPNACLHLAVSWFQRRLWLKTHA